MKTSLNSKKISYSSFVIKLFSYLVTTYDIIVYTGDKRGAGTDANVFVTLFGNQGKQTEKIPLKNSNNKNPFETKQVDKFTVNAAYVGELTKLRVEHDNKGLAAGWYLDRV